MVRHNFERVKQSRLCLSGCQPCNHRSDMKISIVPLQGDRWFLNEDFVLHGQQTHRICWQLQLWLFFPYVSIQT